jgi:hypothetical protein
MAFPRVSRGYRSPIVPAPTAKTADDPTPCMIRVTTSAAKELESPTPSEPRVNIGMVSKYIGRRPSVTFSVSALGRSKVENITYRYPHMEPRREE